ncbi:DUF896 domain-containing protein [Merdimmobilis hominis]|jgi:uncharacterized protein YnzC (UPF0291/DUF896 family)|uniref:UPF0291 protein AULFYP135_01763 n=1 Tax=uncultured Anaerotruncus sp. TaxID=905011 RepID=A0A6N2U6B1_9FIRM|nr:DUF896 domain-containing protein [Merdimmobilis hominis]MCD4835475.1 DUF896 domain-containing protein [Merdimmobilis hominis]PWL64841.1 MAG: DUF896 family protein [Oscillospiraceae bacterium]
MEDKKIQRINELARQSRERELTPEEKAEQKALREEYIAAFRSNLKAQLDATVVVRPDGSRTPLKQRKTELPS